MQKKTIDLFKSKKKEILKLWWEFQKENPSYREDLMNIKEQREQSGQFLESFFQTLYQANEDDINSEDFSEVKKMLIDLSEHRAREGYTPRETGIYIFTLQDALLKTLVENFNGKKVPEKEVISLNKILYAFGITIYESYIKKKEEIIYMQREELLELSTPVIKLWKGILCVPLIGTLDSMRSQQIMETLLTQIMETGYTIAIIDISGVPTIDTLTAQHLMKTTYSAHLMGAECIISGIRPNIAQTIVSLGIDLGSTKTKSSLAEAQQQAFKMLNYRVIED